jgi:sensor histidine kinase regulating citrate/malate metabolism
LILIGIALVFFLVMNFTESKKETTKERIGDAISKTALDTASSIASVAK